jgi:hypothetical protein
MQPTGSSNNARKYFLVSKGGVVGGFDTYDAAIAAGRKQFDLICQVTKDREIDIVLGKTLRVLGHAELSEPVRNLLHRGAPRILLKTLSDEVPSSYAAGRHRPRQTAFPLFSLVFDVTLRSRHRCET